MNKKSVSILSTYLFAAGFLFLGFSESRADNPVPISEARQSQEGDVVTVSGWVTVADQYRGPVYLQDDTAGIAFFSFSLMRANSFEPELAIGDSIVIRGELDEFNEALQLTDANDDFFLEIHSDVHHEPDAREITIDELNSGQYESELVTIPELNIDYGEKVFITGSDYDIQDRTGSSQLYIQPYARHLNGLPIPNTEDQIKGIASVFMDQPQLLPRLQKDLKVDPLRYEGDELHPDETFDVVTWNIEWFGDTDRGPDDPDLQIENVRLMLDSLQADLIAVQEISNITRFDEMVAELDDFRGFTTDYGYETNPDVGFIYRDATVDSLNAEILDHERITAEDHAWRFPLKFRAEVATDDETKEMVFINVHAKSAAGDDPDESYINRKNASEEIYQHIQTQHRGEKVIYLGDYNDQILESTYEGEPSPYRNFDQDDAFEIITKTLEEEGFFSFGNRPFRSMIDHITVSSEFQNYHIEGSQRIHIPDYLDRYLQTTSDHFPVKTRFDLSGDYTGTDSFTDETTPAEIRLKQNYPNPFNAGTTIEFHLESENQVDLKVYDQLGRKVKTLIDSQQMEHGTHTYHLDTTGWATGSYYYTLNTSTGGSITRRMTFIK